MFSSISPAEAAKIFIEADMAAYHTGDLTAAGVLARFENIVSDLTVARGNMNKMFNAWFKQKKEKDAPEPLAGEARQWYMLLMVAMCGKYGVTKPQIVQSYYYTYVVCVFVPFVFFLFFFLFLFLFFCVCVCVCVCVPPACVQASVCRVHRSWSYRRCIVGMRCVSRLVLINVYENGVASTHVV